MPDATAQTSNPAATPSTPSKSRIFFRRLSSTVTLWTIVICALFSSYRWISDYTFFAIMIFLSVTGLAEFYGMVEKRGMACFKGCGQLGGLLLMIGTFLNLTGHMGTSGSPARVNDFETGFLILFVLGLCLRQFISRANAAGIQAISTTLLGLMYVPWLLNFTQKIKFFPGVDGRYYLFYFVLVTKFSDSGAYAVGSLIGRHKMIPRISPGKTWEGLGGAVLGSVLASWLFARAFHSHMPEMTAVHIVILGVLLGLAAVIGDLIESIFKREAGLKDSGKYFPGIGGILDLLDSLLFNAPIMYLYLRHVLTV